MAFMRICSFLVVLLCCADAAAAQQFYQVIDPDGRIRIIESADHSVDQPRAEPVAPTPAAVPAQGDAPPARDDVPVRRSLEGESYLDSEQFEESGFNPERKKRFFILPDTSGTQVQEVESGLPVGPVGASFPEPPPQPHATLEDRLRIMPLTEEILQSQLGGARCLDLREKYESLRPSRLTEVVIDRRVRHFIAPGQLIEAFALGAPGVADLHVQSHSLRLREPAYVEPLIAMAGRDGCVTRIVSGYLQRRYTATQSRHPRLEGSITLLPDEAYVLIVMPDPAHERHNVFSVSNDGRVSIKWIPVL